MRSLLCDRAVPLPGRAEGVPIGSITAGVGESRWQFYCDVLKYNFNLQEENGKSDIIRWATMLHGCSSLRVNNSWDHRRSVHAALRYIIV